MSRFLSDIQGLFDATYSGRYLAFILAELFRRDLRAFTQVLNESGINYTSKSGDSAIANRWPFPVRGQRRFADIAVINAAGDPLILIEIKDADIKNESNAAQLGDYLKFIEQKKHLNVKFLFLTRTIPPEGDEQILQTAKSKNRVYRLFFRQLYKPLKGSKHFGQLLMDYLEDINVAYHHKNPDLKAVRYVTNLMLGIGGRKVTEKSVPDFFEIAFDNLSTMGQWIQNENPKLFKQGFKRRFYVEPLHDVQRINNLMTSKNRKKAIDLIASDSLDEYRKGGEVYFYACGYLTHKKAKVYLEFGYWFSAERKTTKPVTYRHSCGIYANVQWKPWKGTPNDLIEKYATLSSFPDEEAFQKALRWFLTHTRAAALARKSCPGDVKGVLKNLNVP